MSLRTADPLTYRALCYLPAERRRLARAGSGRHRHDARRVSLSRPRHPGFTRAAVIEAAVLATGRLAKIDDATRGHVVILIPGATARELEAATVAIESIRPMGASFAVVRSGPPGMVTSEAFKLLAPSSGAWLDALAKEWFGIARDEVNGETDEELRARCRAVQRDALAPSERS